MKTCQSFVYTHVYTKLVWSNIALQSNLFRLKLKGPMILPRYSWVFEFCNQLYGVGWSWRDQW
jgi:hypothetical protein